MAKGQLYRMPGYAALIGASRRFRRRLASARYCYSVWLRHLVAAHDNNLGTKFPVVVEVGPGDSLGTGIAALLSGARRYVAIDWVPYTNVTDNLDVFEELLGLFESRSPIPDDDEFPDMHPKLKNYAFPAQLIAPFSESSVQRIRWSLAHPGSEDACISYHAPYRGGANGELIADDSIDIVLSQAVMEHVDDPEQLHGAIHGWLKPGGIASHMIDYRCHATSSKWNGHWRYSDAAWRLIRGGRRYLLNRMSHSAHRRLLAASGLDIATEVIVKASSEVLRSELAARFRDLSDDDLTTAGALLQAVKR